MNKLIKFFSALNGNQIIILSSLTLLLVVAIDSWAGPKISTSIFYLIPVGIAAGHSRKRTIYIVSMLAAIIWTIIDLTAGIEYDSRVIPLWNFFMRLGLFLIVGGLVFELKERAGFFEKLAEIDELTGLLNRRGFLTRLDEEVKRAKRFKRQFSIAYIDLDNFKHVNDNYGHKAGDNLLYQVAETLKTHLRFTDQIARVGGDEFTVLFVETDQAGAKAAFDKCYQALNEKLLIEGLGVTLSVGIVTYSSSESSISEIIEKADAWMYRVKKEGKNKVIYRHFEDAMDL